MKTKTIFATLIAVLALGLLGASSDRPATSPVEVGHTYLISTGAAVMKGQIIAEIGNGWYRIQRSDGAGEQSVNINVAFFIVEQKK